MADYENIADVLHEAAETHHTVWRITDGDDPDWASWYADWLLDLSELPVCSEPSPCAVISSMRSFSSIVTTLRQGRRNAGRTSTRVASSSSSPSERGWPTRDDRNSLHQPARHCRAGVLRAVAAWTDAASPPPRRGAGDRGRDRGRPFCARLGRDRRACGRSRGRRPGFPAVPRGARDRHSWPAWSAGSVGGLGFAVSLGIAVAVGIGLHAAGLAGSSLFIAIVLTATSLGIVVPVLKDAGQIASPFGQLIIAGASIADFGAIILLSLFFSREGGGIASQAILLGGFALSVVVIGLSIAGVERLTPLSDVLVRLQDTTAQIRVRGAFLLLIGFAFVAEQLGLETILGAFMAGALLTLLDQDDGMTHEHFREKLEAAGFGIFIPIFFVASGVRFDLGALTSSVGAVSRVPVFLLALLAVRGLPALLYRRDLGTGHTAVAALLQATSLPFIVAATQIGVEIGTIDTVTGSAPRRSGNSLRASLPARSADDSQRAVSPTRRRLGAPACQLANGTARSAPLRAHPLRLQPRQRGRRRRLQSPRGPDRHRLRDPRGTQLPPRNRPRKPARAPDSPGRSRASRHDPTSRSSGVAGRVGPRACDPPGRHRRQVRPPIARHSASTRGRSSHRRGFRSSMGSTAATTQSPGVSAGGLRPREPAERSDCAGCRELPGDHSDFQFRNAVRSSAFVSSVRSSAVTRPLSSRIVRIWSR